MPKKILKRNGIGRAGRGSEKNETEIVTMTKTSDEFPVAVFGGDGVQGAAHFYLFLDSKNHNKKPKIRMLSNLERSPRIKIGILDLRIQEVYRVIGIKRGDVRWENFQKAKGFLGKWLWKKSLSNKKWTNLENICYNWNVLNFQSFGGVKQGFKFWKPKNKLPSEIPPDYLPEPRKLRHQFDIDFGDGLFDFTNLIPPESKFKKMVFLTHNREHRKTPFLLVKVKDDYVPVTIEENPKIRFRKKVKIPGFIHLQQWILKNKNILLKYWVQGAEPYLMSSVDLVEALDPSWRRKSVV